MTAEKPSSRIAPARRGDFRFFTELQTRWSDNDMFGHLNNVTYYRFFEAVVVDFFLREMRVDLFKGDTVPFAAESTCRFRKALSWPQAVEGAFRVEHMGTSSVRYGLALFAKGEEEAAADGHWVHVFVDRETQRPVPIPDEVRATFARFAGVER